MPIFEYQCEECETTFERLTLRPQSTTQTVCPQCGSPRTTKIFSTFSSATGSGAPSGAPGNSAFS